MTYAISNNVQLYTQSVGTGTPVVFVHEFAGDHRNWHDQVRFFSRRYRCITFNARGYPPSDVPDSVDQYSQAHAVEDIANVMQHFGVSDAHIVGVSMGGYATLNFGLTFPQMTRSLTVVSAGHGSNPEQREVFLANTDALAQRLLDLGMEKGISEYAHSDVRKSYQRKDPLGFAQFNRQFAEHSALGSAMTARGYQMRRTPIYELTGEMAQLERPALIIAGDNDEPCLGPALLMKHTIPDARLCVVPNTGHTANLEEPEIFNRTLQEFFLDVDHRLMNATR